MTLKWNRKKYFIFDFDGTIADTNSLHSKAFKEVFRSIGVSDFNYENYKGKRTYDVFYDYLRCRGMNFSNSDIQILVEKKQLIARELMETEITTFDGAIEFIGLLKQKGYILAIATSSSRKGVTLALNVLGIYSMFDYIITGEDIAHAKPSPDIYLKALKVAGIPSEEAIVFEDSESGVQAAESAGLEVVKVNSNCSQSYYCADFSTLIKIYN